MKILGLTNTIFVKGISEKVTEDHLIDIFSNYGAVIKVSIESGKLESSKYALVTYNHFIHALKGIAYMNNAKIDGEKVF
jgi:RNA recognition motif-containing protein